MKLRDRILALANVAGDVEKKWYGYPPMKNGE